MMQSEFSSRRATASKLFDTGGRSAISLRGASNVAPSRESILLKARLERERRAAQRAQERSAVAIQSLARQYFECRRLSKIIEAELVERVANLAQSEGPLPYDTHPAVRFVRALCFLVQLSKAQHDKARLHWYEHRGLIGELVRSTYVSIALKGHIFISAAALGDEAFLLENARRCATAVQRFANTILALMRGRTTGESAKEICRICGPSAEFGRFLIDAPTLVMTSDDIDMPATAHLFSESLAKLIAEHGVTLSKSAIRRICDLTLSLPSSKHHVFLLSFVVDRVGPLDELASKLTQSDVFLKSLMHALEWDPENWRRFAELLEKHDAMNHRVCAVLAFSHSRDYLRQMWHSLMISSSGALLRLFCESFRVSTLVMDDDDFYSATNLSFVLEIINELKEQLFWRLYTTSTGARPTGRNKWDLAAADVLQASSRLLLALWARDARRPFTVQRESLWEVQAARKAPELFVRESVRKNSGMPLLRMAPFSISFETRVRIFHGCIAQEKARAGGGQSFFGMNGIWITIRRNFIVEDAFAQLNSLGSRLRENIRVKFVDEYGLEEAGVDGGGVFKEFMHQLIRFAFSPTHYGLFKATDDGELFPNPASSVIAPSNHLEQFSFLGRILGKALYDAILVDLPIASFFLRKLLGISNDLNDLRSLDPELHRNLKFLRHADPNSFGDLCLTFTVVDNEFGEAVEKELIPGGSSIPVTWDNRLEYMHRVADYRLNRQIKAQTTAFMSGFFDVIEREWIQMFNEWELRELISGDCSGKIDIDNLRSNVTYSGGYSENSGTVELFWQVVQEDLSDSERAALLQFVTSSPRAPLLGFQYLNPPFCIQKAGDDASRYPTASTCMNLLKLPPYSTREAMREKLKYAITQNFGFDLS